MDVQYEGYTVDKIATDDVTLEEICTKFRNYLAKVEGLYFEEDTIRFFISGLGTSHFSILEGLSGTGKSSLPRYFAKFTNSNVLFMPVQATWRDKTNLVGYFNEFSKRYSETEFLTQLYHANYDPDRLHFFVLDEMNISRVEYYFADLLSVLEYPEEEWKLRLMHFPYDFLPPAKLMDGCIKIPNNSYFVGTANKDDSTFTITDKVYDRAITIDFSYRNAPFKVTEEVSTINLSASKFHQLFADAKAATENHLNAEDYEKIEKLTNFIYETFDITFGNRILNQIENLVPVFVACGGTKEDALDYLLSRKVIAKVEGRFEEYVKDALKQFLTLINKTYGKGVLKRSEALVNSLMRRL
jgi:5-methylcytosine-specific restriction endonuclease McrBC GTP-binding regulatory subunit McrB